MYGETLHGEKVSKSEVVSSMTVSCVYLRSPDIHRDYKKKKGNNEK